MYHELTSLRLHVHTSERTIVSSLTFLSNLSTSTLSFHLTRSASQLCLDIKVVQTLWPPYAFTKDDHSFHLAERVRCHLFLNLVQRIRVDRPRRI